MIVIGRAALRCVGGVAAWRAKRGGVEQRLIVASALALALAGAGVGVGLLGGGRLALGVVLAAFGGVVQSRRLLAFGAGNNWRQALAALQSGVTIAAAALAAYWRQNFILLLALRLALWLCVVVTMLRWRARLASVALLRRRRLGGGRRRRSGGVALFGAGWRKWRRATGVLAAAILA